MLLMHNDVTTPEREQEWEAYIAKLSASGALRGGSALGSGVCVRSQGETPGITSRLTGYIKIEARDMGHAKELLFGNPVYEHGGTIEIRELPHTR